MRKIKYLVLLLTAFSLQSAFSQTMPLYLQSGTVHLPANTESFIQGPQPSDVYQGFYYRFLQFEQMPDRQACESIRRSGVLLLNYLPKNTFMAAIPVRYNKNLLSGFGVRSVIPQQENQKISRTITGAFPAWAVKEKGFVDLDVQYHSNIPLEKALAAASAQGKILNHLAINHTITLRISDNNLRQLAAQPWVYFVNSIAAPSEKEDTKGRSLHRSNVINSDYASGRHYDGNGVTVAIADDGYVGPHIDFTGRIVNFATVTGQTHGDMTSGIAVGAGNLDPTIRGMATGADLVTFDISNYPQVVDAVNNYGIYGVVVASTSYSQGCNQYTSDTQFGDQLLFDHPYLQFVFSGGNNGAADCSYGAGAGWGNITGGYKQGKNVIACGNLDALEVLDNSSSRGPSADGRIKPDICANGRDQLSTDENNTYQVGGGTSAASPGIAGIFAQMYQAYKQINNTTDAPSPLIKAAMLNSAEDIGNPGPDFTYGWGRVNALRALRTLEDSRYLQDSVAQGATNTHTINVPANTTQLRAMIYWADPGGTPAAAVSLVNNINMNVSDPASATWNPWVLDPTPLASSLSAPAVRGVDSLNNMEQVTIENPSPGVYTVTINGYAIPSGVQSYYLVWEFRSEEITVTYPNGGEGFVPGEVEVLRWDAERNLGPYSLEYSADNGNTWNTIAPAIPQTVQQFSWTIPNIVSGSVKVRVSRNGFSDESDTSLAIISKPSGIVVNWSCPDSVKLSWNPVNGAVGYTVYQLGQKYMDSVALTTNTSVVITGTNPNNEYWFSVGAITAEGNNGRRANAIYKAPGSFGCPLPLDAGAAAIGSPGSGVLQDCQDNSAIPVSILLENNGQNPLTAIPVSYSLNGAAPVSDLFTGTILPGNNTLFTFTTTVDLSQTGNYTLQVWADYPGDQNAYNDTAVSEISIVPGLLAALPFTEDFESAVLCSSASDCETTVCPLPNGWINAANLDQDDIDFRTIQGDTPSGSTGPASDHTLGTAAGKYVYLESSACFNKTAQLITPCIDLSNASAPQMIFFYHMYGASMGQLHIDIFAQGTWINDAIPAFSGNLGNQWNQGVVNLLPWSGEIINVRFRGITGGNYTSDIALDDINILESSAPPVPAFLVNSLTGCTGKVFNLTDQSLNSPNSWSWAFTPSTVSFVNGTSATSQNPQVVFNAPGTYDVTLTASNLFGGSTVTQPALIDILPAAAVPLTEDFQSGSYPPAGWIVDDAGGSYTWAEASNITGSDGNPTNAAFVDNYDYNNVGAEDGLLTLEMNLVNALSPLMTFDVAHARYSAAYSDSLRIDISTDCGATWTPSVYYKGGTSLATVPDNTTDWAPAAATDWRNDTLFLDAWSGQEILVRFVNINGYGNNIYIDNVNVDAVTGLDQQGDMANVNLYPNPSTGLFFYELNRFSGNQWIYSVSDMQGRVILRGTPSGNSLKRGMIDLQQQPAGLYLLRMDSPAGSRSLKLVKY